MSPDPAQAPPVRVAAWGGEKQLVASADVASGVLLLAEFPIAFVQTQPEEDAIAPWLLLEGILSSDAFFARVSAEDLKLTPWPLGAADEDRLAHLARKYKRNPRKLAQLYHRVAANNVRYAGAEVIGYGIWPLLSRANHSCVPNAEVRGARDRPLVELLLATRPIAAGEAISWNYLSDPAFLEWDWFARNVRLLQDFQFLCRCPRCTAERPPEIAARPKAEIASYFAAL